MSQCVPSPASAPQTEESQEMEFDGDSELEAIVSEKGKSWAEAVEENFESTKLPDNEKTDDYPPLPRHQNEKQAVSSSISYAKAVTDVQNANPRTQSNFYLPPRHDWSRYIFAKCNTRSRPIYVTDVLEGLAKVIDTQKIVSVGPYRSADIFLLELNSVNCVAQLLQNTSVKIEGGDVEFIPAVDNQVTITLVNVPHALTLPEVEQAISPFGTVLKQYHLYCPDPRFNHIIINRRKLIVKLHPHTNIDNIPQTIVIASFRISLFVAGRPPRCHGCGLVGHMYNMCPKLAQTIQAANTKQKSDKQQIVPGITAEKDRTPQVQGDQTNQNLNGEATSNKNSEQDTECKASHPLSEASSLITREEPGNTPQEQNSSTDQTTVAQLCETAKDEAEQQPTIVTPLQSSTTKKQGTNNKKKAQQDRQIDDCTSIESSSLTVDHTINKKDRNVQNLAGGEAKKIKKQQTKAGQQKTRKKSRSPISLRTSHSEHREEKLCSNFYEPLTDITLDDSNTSDENTSKNEEVAKTLFNV